MDLSALVTGGVSAGALGTLGFIAKVLLDAWKAPKGRRVAAVADAVEANAALIKTLEFLQAENRRLVGRVVALEDEADAKDRKIDELEARLNAIADELSDLKRK